MQRVLTFTYNKKKYTSKTWDFEAMCRVQEAQLSGAKGIGMTGGGAVDYLFEGTDATQDVLNAAIVEKMDMCRTVINWYYADMAELKKKTEKNAEAPTEDTAAVN